jgi:hypothetical protein
MAVVPNDDWRRQGQESFLVGLTFKKMPWRSTKPTWDHDHCEFCQTKIAGLDVPDSLHEAYGTPDLYRWVCPQCFEDFREEFKLVEAK